MAPRQPSEVSAGGVVARSSGQGWQVCLVRAGRYWGFPKGHLEAGETPPLAALREIAEECGLPPSDLTIVAELPPSEYAYRRGGRLIFKVVHQFVVIAPSGSVVVPQQGEIDEAEWVSMEEATQRVSFAASRVALAAAEKALRGLTASGAPA